MPMNPRLLRPRSRGGATALPLTISGLEAWYDAADSANVTLDSGRVATWKDKSGKGRNASNLTSGTTQPSYEAAAQNGLSVVRFAAASSQFLAASTAADWKFFHAGDSTVYIAGDFVSAFSALLTTLTAAETGIGSAILLNTTGRFNLSSRVLNNLSSISVNSGTSRYTNNTALVAEFVMLPSDATAANRAKLGVNAAASNLANSQSSAPSTSDPTQPLHIGRFQGGTNPASFDAYEILMYSRYLNASEALAIRQYLYSKWGVTGT